MYTKDCFSCRYYYKSTCWHACIDFDSVEKYKVKRFKKWSPIPRATQKQIESIAKTREIEFIKHQEGWE